MLVFQLRGYKIVFLAHCKKRSKRSLAHKMPVSKMSGLKKLELMALWVSLVCFIWGLEKPYTLHTPYML